MNINLLPEDLVSIILSYTPINILKLTNKCNWILIITITININ